MSNHAKHINHQTQNLTVWEFAEDDLGCLYLISNFSMSQKIDINANTIFSLPLTETEYVTSSVCVVNTSGDVIPFNIYQHKKNETNAFSDALIQNGIDEQFHVSFPTIEKNATIYILHPYLGERLVCDPDDADIESESTAKCALQNLLIKNEFEEIFPYL